MIVVPDDFPSVFEGSPAHVQASAIGSVRVFSLPGAEKTEELVRRVSDAQIAINLRSYVRYTDEVFAACPRLRMVAVWGSGTDNIDLHAARKHGVTVCNTAGVNAGAASEHTFALMLALARRLRTMDADMREGKWPRDLPRQLSGKTLGVFGVGHVGARVVKLGLAFGMTVLAYSAQGDARRVRELGATPSSKDEILRESDFVSLHLRLTPPHQRFIGAAEFAAMKPDAILINTARAHLVDYEALLDALASGKIGGAGLDAFHDEPTNQKERLLGLANTVLSPHMAGQSPEVRIAGMQRVVSNIANYLNGTPTNVVARPDA